MHKTTRVTAVITSVVIATNLVLPMCGKPKSLTKKVSYIKTIQANKPIEPKVVAVPMPVQKPAATPNQPIKRTFRVTAYTAIDGTENGRGITKSGVHAVPYFTVAASDEFPFGTQLIDTKTHEVFVVQDRGGAITGDKLDLYVGHSNVRTALKFGVQYREFIVKLPK